MGPDGQMLMAARGGDYPAIAAICAHYHPRLVEYAQQAGVEAPEAVIGQAVTASLLAIDPARDPGSDEFVPSFERDLFLRLVADVGLDGVVTDELAAGAIDAASIDAGAIDAGAIDSPDVEAAEPGPVLLADQPDAGPVDWRELATMPERPHLGSRDRLRRVGTVSGVVACAVVVAAIGVLVVRSDRGERLGTEPSEQALTARPIDGGTGDSSDRSASQAQETSTSGDGERSTVTVGSDATTTTAARPDEGADDLPVSTSSPASTAPLPSSTQVTGRGVSTVATPPAQPASAPASTTSPATPDTTTRSSVSSVSSTTAISSNPTAPARGGLADADPPTTATSSTTVPSVGDFAGQTLINDAFRGGDLTGYDFTGAVLENMTFEAVDLSGVSFQGAVLRNVTIVRSQLVGADFRNATIDSVGFHSSSISGADFTGANLLSGSIDAEWSTGNPPINLPSPTQWWRR